MPGTPAQLYLYCVSKTFCMKQNKSFFLILGIGALGLLPACKSSDQKSEAVLKFNLQNGKTYEYKMAMDMDNEAQGQKIKSVMSFDYDIAVVGDSAGVKTLKATYKHIDMDMTAPGGKMSFNSDKATDTANLQANPMAVMGKVFGAMVGKSFTLKVDPEGKVTSVSGLSEMADAMLNSIDLPEEAKPQVRQTFDAQFNEDNMKQTFSQAFNIFPNKPVKVGDKWDKQLNMSGMVGTGADAKTTYTVKDISNEKVTLDALSNIEAAGNKIQQSGTMEVARSTGLVTDAKLNQILNGQVSGKTTIKITGKEM